MTPEQLAEFNRMKEQLAAMTNAEDVSFIENIKRRINVTALVKNQIAKTRLGELADVNTSGVTNGQVIKYASSTNDWNPANDIDT